MIGAYIFDKLTNAAAVTALVGTRIYPLTAVQATDRPHIAYQVVSNNPNDTKTSASRLDEVVVQLNIWNPNYDQAIATALEVRKVLDRSSGSVTGCTVQSTRFTGQRDMYDLDALSTGVSIDFSFRIENPLNL